MKFRVSHAGAEVQTLPLWSEAVRLATRLAPKHGLVEIDSVISPDDGGPEVTERVCTVRCDDSTHRKAHNPLGAGPGQIVISFK